MQIELQTPEIVKEHDLGASRRRFIANLEPSRRGPRMWMSMRRASSNVGRRSGSAAVIRSASSATSGDGSSAKSWSSLPMARTSEAARLCDLCRAVEGRSKRDQLLPWSGNHPRPPSSTRTPSISRSPRLRPASRSSAAIASMSTIAHRKSRRLVPN